MAKFPERIICLTEESVETLYLLGEEKRIVGISSFVERPAQAKKLPVVTSFIQANKQKILDLKPDLILGFSDIQKDIARELIAQGLNVFITNQRSLSEILDYILLLGRIVGKQEEALKLTQKYQQKLKQAKKESLVWQRPRVYFEEWEDPMISAIRWVSELISNCGGDNIAEEFSQGSMAKDRLVSIDWVIKQDPQIIFGCWCGKKVNKESFIKRFNTVEAVKKAQVFELPPEIMLQPGPAIFESGIDLMQSYFKKWQEIK